MHEIDTPGNVNGQWVAGDPERGITPTGFSADWMNAVQNEITNVISAAGLTLDKTKNTQLTEAIGLIVAEHISAAAGTVVAVGANFQLTTHNAIGSLSLAFRRHQMESI